MKHTYHIQGMTCSGCQNHVQQNLETVEGVKNVKVDLKKGTAEIEMDQHIDLEVFQKALENSLYTIHLSGEEKKAETNAARNEQSKKEEQDGKGTFYCPMRCEEDKTYDEPGSCPVCGMDLVEEVSMQKSSGQYTCPMHPEVIKDEPGSCPKCGMELVPVEADLSAEEKTYKKLLKKFWIAAGFTIPIFLIAMSEMLKPDPLANIVDRTIWNWIQFGLSLPVIFYATWMFFERAYRSIVTWNLNMFTLIGIGAGVAWIFSVIGLLFPDIFPAQFKSHGNVHVYFEAATVILTLVLLGQLLEARAHSKTNSAVKELLKLAPNKAIRITKGEEEEISIDQIEVGDKLRVKPGDKIPVDGEIIDGNTSIDESMISGEPIPVDKEEGDEVRSGTINGNNSFVMEAQKVGSDTLLSQIIHMVNEASRSRAPIQKLADKISKYFVPIVVLIAVITFIIWAIWGPDPKLVYGFVNAIAVLIIACPCALGLATPMSVMVGVGKGAQLGVLIKDAESLEKMNKIDTLIIDKTGTVTEGKPSVEKILVAKNQDESDVTKIVASVNQQSEHPLAEATVRYAKEKELKLDKIDDFESVTGKGVKAILNGKQVFIGNEKLMKENDIKLNENLMNRANEEQSKGKTVPFVAVEGVLVGCVVISDAIKESSKQAIADLQDSGINVILMTGDNEDTAKAVSEEVNISEFYADRLPEDKLKKVEELQEQGHKVAMAGDGINDAPALAKADIGIAMGTGTDVAIESASITLVKGDLKGIVKAKKLSHKVMRNIKQNLFFALVYNSLGVPIAAGALFIPFDLLLSPMIAAAAMSFSSVSVIANALRLRRAKIK
ncbi:MAG: heavy metal translocating P-type ATPase [Crocinitomicaceae bacterium]